MRECRRTNSETREWAGCLCVGAKRVIHSAVILLWTGIRDTQKDLMKETLCSGDIRVKGKPTDGKTSKRGNESSKRSG